MNTFASLIDVMSRSAVDTLADFDKQAAIDAGIDPTRVRAWANVHDVYYGSASSRQKQRLALEKARRTGFSIDQLAMMEKWLGKVPSIRMRWKLRLALLDVRGTFTTLREAVKDLLPNNDAVPRKRVTFTRSRGNMRTMTVTAHERDLADLEHALSRDLDATRPIAAQLLERFLALIRDGGGVARAVPRPLLLIPLPEWVKIMDGDGDDTVLGLTDGTTITGAEFLREHYANAANHLEAATFHPQHGAVNLYRTQRLAAAKQRDLSRATTPVCPVPGCRHGADSCEIHHIDAWARGGETNIANLAPLCRYHNRTNDDVPGRSKRGRVEVRGGAPVWVSPRGYAVPNSHHQFGAMGSLFGERLAA